MTAPTRASDSNLPRRWLRATTLGWLAGIPVIVIFALIGELIGIGGAQALVGAGMGAGVGLTQSRLIAAMGGYPGRWVLASILGLGIPFLLIDLTTSSAAPRTYQLVAAMALGGLLTGAWQSRLLQRHLHSPWRWLTASFIGWTLAGAAANGAEVLSRAQVIPGVSGALVYLALVLLGGPLVGALTGSVFRRNR